MRRTSFVIFVGAVLALAEPLPHATAQGTASGGPAQAQPLDPARFLEFAHSTAVLQSRIAEIAARKDTRPEVKAFAQDMAAFRSGQLQRLQTLAQERGLKLPAVKEFEHQVVLENLEPLDFLALSRRYAEVQLQALEQEVQAYRAAAQSSDPTLKALADEMPQLEQRLEAARKLRESVGP